MKGLLIKDLLNLKSSLRFLFFIFLFYIVFAIATDNFSFITGMSILLCVMLTFTSFSYDDFCKWDRYALSTPISRRMLVAGKYVLSLFLTLAGGLISLLALLGFFAIKQDASVIKENLSVILVIMALSVFFSCIILPVIFRFGVEKGRLFLFVIIIVPSALLYLLYRMGVPLPDEKQLISWFILFLVFLVFCFYFSFTLSCRIFSKKDL